MDTKHMSAHTDKSRPIRRLILASRSPRRASLMRQWGYTVDIVPPPHGEPRLHTTTAHPLSPVQQAQAISYYKARSVEERIGEGLILAGDTIVSLESRIFGKPADRDHARSMLSTLAGTSHAVITAVTLLDTASKQRRIQHDSTIVTMKPLSPHELDRYLDTGAWRGKAGAYGIQGRADAFIERIDGSFTNVVGFPMETVRRMLSEWGIDPGNGTSR